MSLFLNTLAVLALPLLSLGFSATPKEIYGISGSGWSSPEWHWGRASGTGHECAQLCRRKYDTPRARRELVAGLVLPKDAAGSDGAGRAPASFEEVKLVLALAWQKALNGPDGEPRAYAEVLDAMAAAQRYEGGSDEENSLLLVQDMQKRFFFLDPAVEDRIDMNLLLYEGEGDWDWIRRRCSGLVLRAMDFEENGL